MNKTKTNPVPPTLQEILTLIKRVKWIDEELLWERKPTNTNFLACKSTVLDASRVTIPGVHFESIFKPPLQIEEEKYSFGLFQRKHGQLFRLFQLEVDSWDKMTHRDRKKNIFFYGPHYHIGCHNSGPESIEKEASKFLQNRNFDQWFARFKRHAKLKTQYRLHQPGEIQINLL